MPESTPQPDANTTPPPANTQRWAAIVLIITLIGPIATAVTSGAAALRLAAPDAPPVTTDSLDLWRPTFQPEYFQGLVTSRAVLRPGSIVITQQNDDAFAFASTLVSAADFDARLPEWSELQSRDPIIESFDAIGFDASPRRYIEIATGWPRLAFRCDATRGTDHDQTNNALTVPGQLFDDNRPRLIPIRPILSGLVVNSLIYSTAFTGILVSIRLGRHQLTRRRRSRGRCGACGYDRTGTDAADPCPECGRR